MLEQLDPSEGYRGTPLENTDAFQRQLKRFGIRVKGAGSDTVEKFFSTFESAVLFPEFLARAVRQGMDEANILPAITATVTRIDAMDYRSIYSVPEEADRSLAYVAEGASIPATAIRTREHLVRLYKRGRMLVASYEALRFQKLDLFSVMLRQIGAQIQAMHLEAVSYTHLDAVLRQDGERRDLRAAAGRRRHGYKADGQAAERGDALGAVDGGAAAEGQNGVRLQGLQAGDALRHQRKRGIGRDVGENLDLRAGKGRGIAGGRAVFGKIGVRDEQHALGVQPGEGRGGVRAEAQPRAADKALHDIASFRR